MLVCIVIEKRDLAMQKTGMNRNILSIIAYVVLEYYSVSFEIAYLFLHPDVRCISAYRYFRDPESIHFRKH